MAIVQISRITQRKGLAENGPGSTDPNTRLQLAGAEFGWCVDTRQLFIGNGTLEEGAPVIGNTEILTEFSDIAALSNYTYADVAVGYAAQTGPTPSAPIVRTVQAKLDDFADVRDFGAVGDGETDDTEAINRALYQLYCRDNNPLVRRTLYFPAGVYLVRETIIIPTYAKLVGEGANCSIIRLDTSADISSLSAYVARYGDSLQQTGVNIGTNGATPPRNIEISSMSFESIEVTDVFLVDRAFQCWFDSVNFIGPLTGSITTALDDISGVRFNSSAGLITHNITFDKCRFEGLTYGIATSVESESITVSNSKFDTLHQGIVLDGNGPTGFRALHNYFDSIYAEGIVYNNVVMNVSAYNAFYNVGNSNGSNPVTAVIRFGNDNNVSVSDMFTRTNDEATTVARITISGTNQTTVGDSTNSQLQLGRYTRENGQTLTLENNSSGTAFTINSSIFEAFSVDYTIKRAPDVRHGRLTVVPGPDDSSATLSYSDDYSQNGSTGITLSVSQTGTDVDVDWTSSNTGTDAEFTFSISHLA